MLVNAHCALKTYKNVKRIKAIKVGTFWRFGFIRHLFCFGFLWTNNTGAVGYYKTSLDPTQQGITNIKYLFNLQLQTVSDSNESSKIILLTPHTWGVFGQIIVGDRATNWATSRDHLGTQIRLKIVECLASLKVIKIPFLQDILLPPLLSRLFVLLTLKKTNWGLGEEPLPILKLQNLQIRTKSIVKHRISTNRS